jgi:phosphoserine phosphatase
MQNMGQDKAGVPREFLLKQIENEINAGFAFVAAARNAYRLNQSTEAETSLQKAAETHEQASKELAESAVDQVRNVTHQLTELREAIDWLRENHFTRSAGK